MPKSNKGLRLYIDYRALNKFIVKNRHALLLIDETIDRLSGTKIYTKLNLKDAYYRIRMKASNKWKIAFRTRYGHFEYIIMPFSLTNVLITF
jgi:DNA-binding NtrC family response regulator